VYQANNTPQAMENPPEGSGVELRARQLERAQLMKAWMWSGLTFIGAYASGAASFYFFSLTDAGLFGVGSERSARLIGLGFGLLAVLLFVLAFVIAVMRRIRIIERRDERVREAVGDAAFDVLDARDWPGLARANSRQLSLYQQLAHRQARSSYRHSQIAISIGLTVLIVGAVAAIFVPTTIGKITTATLSAVGTILSGYISRTYLRVYERTLAQLNFYFRQPLITSYVFTAERLTEKMSQKKRDSEYSLVIRDLFGALSQGEESPNAKPQEPQGSSNSGSIRHRLAALR
jgi:hypothetical protein